MTRDAHTNDYSRVQRCPICRGHYYLTNLLTLNHWHPAIKREFKNIKIDCPNGCGCPRFDISEIEAHLRTGCSSRIIKCPAKGCTTKGKAKEIETDHLPQCRLFKVSCKNCGIILQHGAVTGRRKRHANSEECIKDILEQFSNFAKRSRENPAPESFNLIDLPISVANDIGVAVPAEYTEDFSKDSYRQDVKDLHSQLLLLGAQPDPQEPPQQAAQQPPPQQQ